jgi:hypothetical protein
VIYHSFGDNFFFSNAFVYDKITFGFVPRGAKSGKA